MQLELPKRPLSRRAARFGSFVLIAIGLLAVPAVLNSAERHNTLSNDEIAGGWISLFDGESFFGWKAANKADWKISGGTIVVTQGEKGLLCTTTQFADYVLKVDFRSAKGTNSGIFLRTETRPKNPQDGCYELNIADHGSTPFATGALVSRKKTAGNYDSADWQSYEVTMRGARVQVKLDGKMVMDYTDPQPVRRGHIGLQLNSGKVEFRNVKLKPLSLTSIFNGKDLTGWYPTPEKGDVFSVTEKNEIAIRGGKGQLESKGKYGDFVLQLDALAGANNANSGLFFRSIPGETMNGYECQLQNSYGRGGEKNLIDCGTGGICRRQKARKIVAKDFEWFHLTLVADGPHMAAWVNGYPVSDWTDVRKPDRNPRRGKRLKAGTLIFQAHDPTTRFLLKNIYASEIPKP